jgi:vacuolar protein sorting-associated protein 13A/C
MAELAGVDMRLEWDEEEEIFSVSLEPVDNDLVDEAAEYSPPKSDVLYDINKARVSPFTIVVTFKREPETSRYKLLKDVRGAKLMNYFTTRLKFTLDRAELKFARYEASNIRGPANRLLEILTAVYVSRMKMKFVTIMKAVSFQDWKFLASREEGDDEYVEGDILRVTGNAAGRTANYVLKKVGVGLGDGLSHATSKIGDGIENATEMVGVKSLGAGVNSVVSGVGEGVGETVKGGESSSTVTRNEHDLLLISVFVPKWAPEREKYSKVLERALDRSLVEVCLLCASRSSST